jgi:hypothetical protein
MLDTTAELLDTTAGMLYITALLVLGTEAFHYTRNNVC